MQWKDDHPIRSISYQAQILEKASPNKAIVRQGNRRTTKFPTQLQLGKILGW
jgi:hypothetical protein